jgi:hypothetical protein
VAHLGLAQRGLARGGVTTLQEADQQLAEAGVDGSSTLFVIGLGSGAVLDALDRRGWNGRVVAFEPNPAAVESRRWGHWSRDERLTILLGPEFDGLDRVVPSLAPEQVKPLIVVNYDVAATAPDAAKDAMRVAARAWFGARANQEARREFAPPYLLNTLRNVKAIAAEADAGTLRGAFPGVPAIVVGAGPSLDRNIDEIAAHRGRAIVIAADTALRPLLAAAVAPDLVVAVDPGEANARHLTDLTACPATWLVAEGSVDPAALAAFAGRSFVCRVASHHPWPWLQGHGIERGTLRAWGSVLTTAFDLALVMGCDPIVFAGADLAFTGGQPYARKTTYESDWRREQAWGDTLHAIWSARVNAWPELFEPGIDGEPVRTAPHLRSFRDWIVREAAHSTRTVVNASGGGILLGAGIRQGSIVDALPARRVAESVATRLATLHGARAGTAPIALPGEVDADTRRAWISFAGVTDAAIEGALNAARALTVSPQIADVCARPTQAVDDPRARDAVFLAELSRTYRLRMITLTDPAQDLLGELRRECARLAPEDAVVIVDELDLAAGSQVRRALDAVLCERPDLWLEYRRFVHYRSRLSVVRGEASRHTPRASEADADKWTAAHKEVADRLAPLIAGRLAPTSVVDLGCGAGHWLDALARGGVPDVAGITPRQDGEALMPSIVRAPLDRGHDLGRRFDLCLCLEVAQQFAPERHDAVIDACTSLSDVIVFSSRTPGTPGTSPHARPLPYWAEKFWRRGYVLDDSLRGLADERWNFPYSIYDCLVIFRREFEPAAAEETSPERRAMERMVLRSAARVHELYTKSVWWAASAINGQGTAMSPCSPFVALPMPPARLVRADGSERVFSFRTEAARWYLTHRAAAIDVLEDGCPLPQVATREALAGASRGGWVLRGDEIAIKSSDGSDPRTNGRLYTVSVPAHVAWAETRSLDECLAHQL